MKATGDVMVDDGSDLVPDGHAGNPAAPRHAPTGHVRRETAMWLVCVGVLIVVLMALLVDAQAALVALAGVLLVAGIVRGVVPGPGPIGITIRSRGVDLTMFLGLALVISILSQTVPNI